MGLVLSRKIGQRILIGQDISIMPVRISENAVRFQIDAPKKINIVREELKEHAIQASEADVADIGRRPASVFENELRHAHKVLTDGNLRMHEFGELIERLETVLGK